MVMKVWIVSGVPDRFLDVAEMNTLGNLLLSFTCFQMAKDQTGRGEDLSDVHVTRKKELSLVLGPGIRDPGTQPLQ